MKTTAKEDAASLGIRYELTAKRSEKRIPTFAEDLRAMMAGWDKIMKAVEVEFPSASPEEKYQIAKGAMQHALGIR